MKALLRALPVLWLALPALGAAMDGTDRIVIRFKSSAENRAATVSSGRMRSLNRRLSGGSELRHMRRMSGDAQVMRLQRKMSGAELQDVIDRLAADPDVEYAAPSRKMFPALVPTDTQYSTQWHYRPTASFTGSANLEGAWDVTTGNPSVIIAVVDTGITGHTDLSGRSVAGYDFVGPDGDGTCGSFCSANDGDGWDSDPSDPGDWITNFENTSPHWFQNCGVTDSTWHGTHVAGTVGAAGDNAAHVAGVNWGSKILPVRVLGKCGGYDDEIADGIRWAAGLAVSGAPTNSNPAKVINLSLGGISASCPSIYQTAITDAVNAGAVVITAAGNNNGSANSFTPANCAGAVSVAAITKTGAKASYSNSGTSVDIAAPGGDFPVNPDGVMSTYNSGTTVPSAQSNAQLVGTSMAAPHVSGVAGLMLSVDSTLTPAQVLAKLQANTRGFPGLGCNTSNCGAGMLDANLAVRASVVQPVITSISPVTKGVSSITYTWSFTGPAPNSWKVYDNSDNSLEGTVGTPSFTWTGLSADTAYAVKIAPVRLTVEGGTTVSASTRTFANPVTLPGVNPGVTTADVTWTPCAGSACSGGYRVDVALSPSIGAPAVTAVVASPAATGTTLTGLAKLTEYYGRINALNGAGGASPVFFGPFTTLTDLVPVSLNAPTAFTSGGFSLSWGANGNPPSSTYEAAVTSVSNYSSGLVIQTGVDMFSAVFTGLQSNTSYYARVRAIGAPPVTSGPHVTHAAAPSPVGMTGVGLGGMDLTWTANGNAPPNHSVYLAEVSLNPSFAPVIASSSTRNVFARFTGLVANTTHYGRVRVLPTSGPQPGNVSLGFRATPALPPAAAGVSGLSPSAARFFYTTGGNPSGTVFRVHRGTDAAFTSYAQLETEAIQADFGGLEASTTYFFRVAALNLEGQQTAFSALSGATLPNAPAAAVALGSNASLNGITMNWAANGNGKAHGYRAEIDDDPGFGSVNQSSVTYNLNASFTGLNSNTVYYLRVKKLGFQPAADSAWFTPAAGAATLAPAPVMPASAFLPISYASSTAVWIARPAAPLAASAYGYRLEYSLDAGFTGVIHSSTVYGSAASTAMVTGLQYNTVYFARVGSLNADGMANFLTLGSTRTLMVVLSSTIFTGAPVSLFVDPVYPEFSLVNVNVPMNAFPAGTPITVHTSVGGSLPAFFTNQAGITPISVDAGFSLSANGLQPNGNVLLRMIYDPLALPPATDPTRMRLFRYDEGSRQWTILPGSVDTKTNVLSGMTNHFSLFAPFLVTAGTVLDATQIFPIPWAPASGDARFNAPAITFANLPPATEVRILTITGEQLWAQRTDATGTVTWDGITKHGRRTGSGTYLVLIEKDGARLLRRVVIVR